MFIKYKMSRTSNKEIVTMCNVKYNYDYANSEYNSESLFKDQYSFFMNGDSEWRQDNNLPGYSYESLK